MKNLKESPRRKRRAELKKTNENKSDDYQQLQDSINALCDDELNLSNDDPVSKKVKKTWNKRPENWQFIAKKSHFFFFIDTHYQISIRTPSHHTHTSQHFIEQPVHDALMI